MTGSRRRLVTFALLILVLATLTAMVVAHGPMVLWDQRIRDVAVRAAAEPRWSGVTTVARWYSDAGDPALAVAVVAVVAGMVGLRRRSLAPLLRVVLAVVALLVTVLPPKLLIDRTGPNPYDPGNGGDGFFPSGHTTTAVVCYGTAVLLAVGPRRMLLAALAALLALYGATLVWCDYHWASDVVAGWALGALLLGLLFPPAVSPEAGRDRQASMRGR